MEDVEVLVFGGRSVEMVESESWFNFLFLDGGWSGSEGIDPFNPFDPFGGFEGGAGSSRFRFVPLIGGGSGDGSTSPLRSRMIFRVCSARSMACFSLLYCCTI